MIVMKKAYIQPVCEEINVHLIGSVLDGADVAGWSMIAAGDDPTGEYADGNRYTFDEEEGNDEDAWNRVGPLWENL